MTNMTNITAAFRKRRCNGSQRRPEPSFSQTCVLCLIFPDSQPPLIRLGTTKRVGEKELLGPSVYVARCRPVKTAVTASKMPYFSISESVGRVRKTENAWNDASKNGSKSRHFNTFFAATPDQVRHHPGHLSVRPPSVRPCHPLFEPFYVVILVFFCTEIEGPRPRRKMPTLPTDSDREIVAFRHRFGV